MLHQGVRIQFVYSLRMADEYRLKLRPLVDEKNSNILVLKLYPFINSKSLKNLF